jgi:hypothetical protein
MGQFHNNFSIGSAKIRLGRVVPKRFFEKLWAMGYGRV